MYIIKRKFVNTLSFGAVDGLKGGKLDLGHNGGTLWFVFTWPFVN